MELRVAANGSYRPVAEVLAFDLIDRLLANLVIEPRGLNSYYLELWGDCGLMLAR